MVVLGQTPPLRRQEIQTICYQPPPRHGNVAVTAVTTDCQPGQTVRQSSSLAISENQRKYDRQYYIPCLDHRKYVRTIYVLWQCN